MRSKNSLKGNWRTWINQITVESWEKYIIWMNHSIIATEDRWGEEGKGVQNMGRCPYHDIQREPWSIFGSTMWIRSRP